MVQYQEWMFDASQWGRFQAPTKAWHHISFHVIVNRPEVQAIPAQNELFNYTFACMLQKDTGWN